MRLDQRARGTFGHDAAMVQHYQPVAQALRFVHEMRGQQDGGALLQQPLQALPHQVARLRIEAGGGLVQQQQSGRIDQRTRQAQAPLHAARELARLGVGLVREGGKFQQLRNALADLLIRQSEIAAKHQQILGAGEIRIKRIELRDHAQMLLDGQRIARHCQAVEGADHAVIGRGQAQAHAQRGGLAGAVGADHPQTLARRNAEGHIVHRRELAKALAQVFGSEQRRGRRRAHWKATSWKLRSLRLCRLPVAPARSSSSARMPMRRCWSTRSR